MVKRSMCVAGLFSVEVILIDDAGRNVFYSDSYFFLSNDCRADEIREWFEMI